MFVAARASCPSQLIEGIRQVYKKCEGVVLPVPWCEEFNFQIEDIFTRLRIVAKEKTRGIATTKELTNMTSVFIPHECSKQPLIVLIEGEPGMGKTTYCQKLAFDWASKDCVEWDESFPRIDVLLFLRCRGIESTIWDAIEEQILPKELKREESEMFFQFLKENPSKLLLVLDGLDEVDPEKLEMFINLIQSKLLPGCYIVLTGRHEAGRKVRQYADTLLEIVGFTTSDVECYIRKYFQHAEHLAEALISKFMFDEDLRELSKNPLNTLLLCVIFEDLDGILPNNRTKLYVEIVRFVLRRYESKNDLSNRGEDLLLVYKKELMMLGETALYSLREGELYFDDHKGDIKKSLLTKFGFLSIQSGGSKRAPCDRYAFFHKSFQEFFSGYFLAFSVIDDIREFHSVLTDERYMDELFHVVKFMIGIGAMRSEETAVSIVKSIASIVNDTGGTSDKFRSNLRFAHELINECKTCSGNKISANLDRAFGESLDLVGVDSGGFIYLNLQNSEPIETFFQALAFNSTVLSLKLSDWHFSTKVLNSLAEALRVNTSLSSLDLQSNLINWDGAKALAEALRCNTSLSFLKLSSNNIGDWGTNSLAQALKVNTSLSSLTLHNEYIGAEAANSLAQALRVNTSLSSLKLDYADIGGAEGATSLAQALRVNNSLSSLEFRQNSIGAEGAVSLAQALRVNTSLSSLKLFKNSIGADGANSLAESLKVSTSLSSLELHCEYIGAEGATSLAQALRENTSVSTLNLSNNSIGPEGVDSLAAALRVNTSLSSLILSHNSIGAKEIDSLAQAVEANNSLSSLNLNFNLIRDEGANSLAQALILNTSLSSLSLVYCYIGDKGANSLAEALRVNTSLSSLDLRLNNIGDEGTLSLAMALSLNTSLSLDLSRNFILE